MMIGEGRVKTYINCYTANSGYTNVSRRFRAAIEKGAATAELFAIPFREQMGRAKSVPDDRYAAVYADMAREMEEQIADIAARGGVSCACGSKTWTFRVNYSSVDLVCGQCGAEMRIPAATADDIDDLCCKTSLLIRGRAGT